MSEAIANEPIEVDLDAFARSLSKMFAGPILILTVDGVQAAGPGKSGIATSLGISTGHTPSTLMALTAHVTKEAAAQIRGRGCGCVVCVNRLQRLDAAIAMFDREETERVVGRHDA